MTAETGSEAVTPETHALTDAAPHVPPTVRRTRRMRRPSGAPPPLPRSIGRSGRGWIATLIVFFVWIIVMLSSPGARRTTDRWAFGGSSNPRNYLPGCSRSAPILLKASA